MKKFLNWLMFWKKKDPKWQPHQGPYVLDLPGIGELPPITPIEEPVVPAPSDPNPEKFSVAPDHTASICHLLIHDPIGLSWDEAFPEKASELRDMLKQGVMPDAYLEKINDRFRFVSKALWGKETTTDDIKYAFSKLAYTSEVK